MSNLSGQSSSAWATLSGVVKEALPFRWDLTSKGTSFSGSTLEIEDMPVAIYWQPCAAT